MKQKEWIEKIGKEEMDSRGLEPLFATVASYLPKDIETTLSVGCGNGRELPFYPGAKGLDYNPINGSNPLVTTGDMHDIPFQDGEFDLVISRDSFEHATSPITALSEMSRVSRKYVCIVLPDLAWTESDWHLIIPDMRQLMNLAEKCGLAMRYRRDIRFVMHASYVLENHLYLFQKIN